MFSILSLNQNCKEFFIKHNKPIVLACATVFAVAMALLLATIPGTEKLFEQLSQDCDVTLLHGHMPTQIASIFLGGSAVVDLIVLMVLFDSHSKKKGALMQPLSQTNLPPVI